MYAALIVALTAINLQPYFFVSVLHFIYLLVAAWNMYGSTTRLYSFARLFAVYVIHVSASEILGN